MKNNSRRWFAELCPYGRDTVSEFDKLYVFDSLSERDATISAHEMDKPETPHNNELVPVTYSSVKHKYTRDGQMRASYMRANGWT